MPKYKIIACDLDETLLKMDRTLDERDRAAIAAATEAGVKFVPATGRGWNSVRGTLRDLGLYEEPGQYVISYNGGAVTENAGEKVLHFQGIGFDVANALWQRGLAYDVCMHVYPTDMVWAHDLWQEEIDYLAGRMEIEEVDWTDLTPLAGQDIVKVLYCNPDLDYLRQVEREVADLTQGLDVSYSSNRYLEFNAPGVNKGLGLRKLAEHLGVDMSETIAIGDNLNDLPMIKAAGLGVGVANSVESMRGDCDYVCRATCDECAVAEVIERFVL